MTKRRQKHLVLILARELASNLAQPTLIVDDEGMLVFFNEAAEEIFQRTFVELGEIPFEEWATEFRPADARGRAAAARSAEPPGSRSYERRAAHERIRITSVDGVEREVAVDRDSRSSRMRTSSSA